VVASPPQQWVFSARRDQSWPLLAMWSSRSLQCVKCFCRRVHGTHKRAQRARTRHQGLHPNSDARATHPCTYRQRSQEEALADRPLLSGSPPPMSFFVSMPEPPVLPPPPNPHHHTQISQSCDRRPSACSACRQGERPHLREKVRTTPAGAHTSRCHPRTPHLHANASTTAHIPGATLDWRGLRLRWWAEWKCARRAATRAGSSPAKPTQPSQSGRAGTPAEHGRPAGAPSASINKSSVVGAARPPVVRPTHIELQPCEARCCLALPLISAAGRGMRRVAPPVR